MMENFYYITKKQARDLGRIEYGNNQTFDPFCGETLSGFYLISETMYNVIKDLPQAANIDWSLSKFTSKENLQLRQLNMPNNITNSDWKELSQAFFYSSLMSKAIQNASPNAYSTFLKVLTDGENNYASENAFLAMFNAMGITWTTAEKAEINTILTNNNFTVQIS